MMSYDSYAILSESYEVKRAARLNFKLLIGSISKDSAESKEAEKYSSFFSQQSIFAMPPDHLENYTEWINGVFEDV